ncbi:MAG TPA: hypothetical protein DCL61_03355 [Cyanobacteria bacterium UBA12227]|nr:hypothetical protein [Cyanobacteria bacterium UBA12227]HAX85507.1 hypothetical protein [Cyanobacteria bacterium UBA11370]HBY80264.1 hypothetical protein [Cyanobacteria bacterium UBA11148]
MISRELTLKKNVVAKLDELFGFDLRSLAVLRIGLALLILADLIKRSQYLNAHYTDLGILPRGPLIEQFSNRWFWSLHFLSGESFFQGILFVLAGLLALSLLIGYKTRWVTILSWALLLSLQNRNSIILNAGDMELRLLMFWGMFLPLGACYSVDSALNSSPKRLPERILSGATLALTLQICFIYWFTAILKDHPIWWKEGTAVYYALNLDSMATPVAHLLLKFPAFVLVFFTFTTLWIELVGPFFLFVPFRTDFFRVCTVITFILLHINFGAALNIGIFPFVSSVAWLVFLPSGFWNGIAKRLQTNQRQGLQIYYDQDSTLSKKTIYLLRTFLVLPQTPLLIAQDEPENLAEMKAQNSGIMVVDWQGQTYFNGRAIAYLFRQSPLFRPLAFLFTCHPLISLAEKTYQSIIKNPRTASQLAAPLKFRPVQVRTSWGMNIVTLLLLICVLFWNLRSIAPSTFKIPKPVYWVSWVLRLDQRWSMFAPFPSKEDGWYVIPGELKDGTEIDVFKNGKPVTWQKPSLVSATYPNERWRKYMMNLWSKKNEKHRLYYGRYLCRNWNSKHKGSKQLKTFKIYFMLEKTLPNYQPPEVKKVMIWKHNCFKAPQD